MLKIYKENLHMKKFIPILLASFLIPLKSYTQQWVEMMQDPKFTVQQVDSAFQAHWNGKSYERGKGWKQYQRWKWFNEQRTYPSGQRIPVDATWKAFKKEKRRYSSAGVAKAGAWAPIGPSVWQSTSYNPGTGRVNVVAEEPGNPNVIYIGAPAGGLWKSTDAGTTWTPLIDDFPTLGVSGIVIDPSNTNVVYISTGDGDGSDTYSNGVLKSTDGGLNWISTGLDWSTTQSRTTRRLIMHPSNNQILYCASNNGLYRTDDGGSNWNSVQSGSIRDVEFKPGDPSTVYTCTDEFFKSTDNGLTFTQVTNGLPVASDVNRMSITISQNDPNVVYALLGGNDSGFYGLYRSSDSGDNWTQQSNSPNIFTYSSDGSGSGGQSWYDMALAADTGDANVIYAGGINVWKSTDAGVNWTIISHWTWPSSIGYTHADIHTLDMFGTNLYCGSDGGIFRSSDGGANWTDISSGLQIMQFYRIGGTPQDANLLIGGAQDNGTNRMNGTTWTHVLGADGMEAAIDPTDVNTMYCNIQSGGLRRSLNGGAGWGSITGGLSGSAAWVAPFFIHPSGPDTIYAARQDVWESGDQGSTWTQISSFGSSSTLRTLMVSNADPNYIYTGSSGTIRRTNDSGTNWIDISAGLPNLSKTYFAVHPLDPQIVYVTLSGYNLGEKVFVSTDAGLTWTNISGNLPNIPVNTVVFEEGSQGGLYVGTDLGVYYTDSTLSNWQFFSDNLPNVIVQELEIHYPTQNLRAATYGRGVWETPLWTALTVPPVSQFTNSSTTICAGESIKFFDNSIGAAPGWTWSFPGGTPSSSTNANPVVTYPSSGTYQISLTVSNDIGPSTVIQNIDVIVPSYELYVHIVLDNYPNETTWSIEGSGGELLASGGPYSGIPSGTLIGDTICVSGGCFDFIINDSYGDGICCGFGQGSYVVQTANMDTVAQGGNFTFSEATNFCLGIQANLKMILEGPYNSASSLMDDDLRAQGLIPNSEPFTGLGFTHIGSSSGTNLNPALLNTTGNNAIVDWVFVELRDGSDNSSVLATQVGLVQRDGDVISASGENQLTFDVGPDNYFVAIRHRNHLGALTLNSVDFSTTPTLDFSDPLLQTYGTEAQFNNSGTTMLWAGNSTVDNVIKYTGLNNDRDPILVAIGGTTPTATVTGYFSEDVNMDGDVMYTGSGNDRDRILINIGGTVPTNIRMEQLP